MSYEAVLNSNNETMNMGESAGGPDLTNAQLAAPLRHAQFVVTCGAPDDMKVQVRVAVRMGGADRRHRRDHPAERGDRRVHRSRVRGIRWAAKARPTS